ncbi:hypothetical protein AX761_22000 [Rhizobium sp. 58]|nr:hypothetical protein AX761_22000 [Rhizobium sp. 58]
MNKPLPTLSDGLTAMLETFEPHVDQDRIEFDNASLGIIIHTLRVMRKLADNMEMELSVFRLGEDGHSLSGVLDVEATSQLVAMTRDPEGTVITPDFGRRS